MSRRRALQRMWRDTSGAAAAEMVLLLPLATFMLLLAMEAGWFMYSEHQVVKSVRDAARYGARQPFSTTDCDTSGNVVHANAAARTQADLDMNTLARYGRLDTTGPLMVAGWEAGEVDVTYDCVAVNTGLYKDRQYAPRVTVTGTPGYPAVFGGAAVFGPDNTLYARQQAVAVGL